MWLHAPNIACTHGFSLRHGGISPAPFNSLNLGGSDDDPVNIRKNREKAFHALGLHTDTLHTLKQVHGNRVCEALATRQEGDALVSNRPGAIISVLVADCYPVLFYDKNNGVIGAAHCGWRGTLGGIAPNTVEKMLELGAEARNISVAIGPGISQKNFQVGEEVIEQFRAQGFPHTCWSENKIDLIKCILFTLDRAGIAPQNTWCMNRCTYEPDFFSYRRDKGKTGRMMALICMDGK